MKLFLKSCTNVHYHLIWLKQNNTVNRFVQKRGVNLSEKRHMLVSGGPIRRLDTTKRSEVNMNEVGRIEGFPFRDHTKEESTNAHRRLSELNAKNCHTNSPKRQ